MFPAGPVMLRLLPTDPMDKDGARDRMLVSLSNFYVEILSPKVMVLGGGPLGGDEDRKAELSPVGLMPL